MNPPPSPPTPLATAPPGPVAFGDCVLDAAEARLWKAGRPVPIQGRALALLALLVAHPQRLLGPHLVLDAVWGHRHVSRSALKGTVNVLRALLGDDAQTPRYIETVPRRGLRCVAAVRPVSLRANGLPVAPDADPAPRVAPDRPAASAGAPVASAPDRADPPAAATAAAAAGNLPPTAPATAPLIGREAELAALEALLAAHRLVTLTGLGGVGKTRLALAAAQAWPAPPDGRWLLRLDAMADAAPLLPALAQLLGLGTQAAGSAQALAQALAGHQALLVLDNAEHLVDAVAALVQALLAAAPGLMVLVTSQVALRLVPEQVLLVAPLALPADAADAAPPPEGYAAAQLLCQRVRQQRPGWQPRPGDAADIGAICRALDGVPLALELAAARVPLLGLAGVRARLDQRFALLTRGPRDAAERHRTLAAALDWTVGLLSPAERAALQQLALCAGSLALDDALALLQTLPADPEGPEGATAGATALDWLDELLARSLVVREPGTRAEPGAQPDAGAAADAPRLRLYDSVRRHALQALDSGPHAAPARLRQLRWLAGRMQALAHHELCVPLLHWLPALRQEADSLRAALRDGLDPAAPAEALDLAVRLCACSLPFWARSGLRSEGWHWLQASWQAQAARPGAISAASQALLHYGHGQFVAQTLVGEPAPALADLLRARPALQAAGDQARVHLSHYFALHLQIRLDPQAPRGPLLQAMQDSLDPAWPPMARRMHSLLAAAELARQGKLAAGAALLRQTLQALRAAGAQAEAWPLRNMLAQLLLRQDAVEAAWQQLGPTATEIEALGLLREQALHMAMTAAIGLRRGLDATSRGLALRVLRVLAADGLVWWLADALPWAAWHAGRPADAARLQHWADGLVAARQEQRGPVFSRLRETLQALLGPAAALPPGSTPPADDRAAVALAFGADGVAAVWPARGGAVAPASAG